MNARSASLFARLALISGLAVSLVAATLSVASPAQAQKIRPNFFGMHDGEIANGSVPGVKTGATRLWDTRTSWREIETSPGVFDFTTTTRAVANARMAGLRPMLVLGQTPQFHATDDPDTYEAYGDGATSMPRMAAWKRYVERVAQVYGNQVDYQIWNEPNVINYWSGSVRDMARLTEAASRKIENVVGRKATVVAPAFPLRLDGQRDWFRKYWNQKVRRKSIAKYVNVVSANLYPLAPQAPEASMKLLKFAKRALPKAARGKPVWNTEINYGLLGGATAKDISAAKEAAFVARTYLLNGASNVRRVYWYRWGVGPIANTHLVEDDRQTLTRAGHAHNEVHGWLRGTNLKNCKKDRRGKTKGVYTCTARESRTEVRRFYWKPSGRDIRIRTHKTTKKWTELNGDTHKRKGRFRVKVGQAPIMVTSRR